MAITQKRLRELLRYDPETGEFTWRVWRPNGVKPGDPAGNVDTQGYRVICAGDRTHKAHRLAWLWMTGEWPTDTIDHINGVKSDNRWLNLRSASRSLNKQNMRQARSDSATGLIGAFPWRGKFKSAINAGGRRIHLGYFATAAEAHAAYVTAKRRLHEGCTI